MGTRNFEPDVAVPGVNIDPHLCIGFIRVPVYVSYDINLIKFTLGYSLNYSYRKNQNFFAVNSSQFVDVYSDFQHAVIAGIRKDWRLLSVACNLHIPLNSLSNTGLVLDENTLNEKLRGLQISMGYILR